MTPEQSNEAIQPPKKTKKKKNKLMRKILYYGLICVFAAVFVGSAVYIGNYMIESLEASSEYDAEASLRESILADLATATTQTDPPPQTDPSTGETVPPEPTEPVMLPELVKTYNKNKDTVGWITVPGTKINYPVMQTPNKKDYYLKWNFKHVRSDWGAIYVREECDVFAPSDNLTIYGHHMKDGSMFAGLDKYKKKKFWTTHQTFSFDTLYERHTYQIWAVFKTSANAGEGFAYHHFVDAADEEAFNAFVAKVKSIDYYETGITPKYGDKLLCLSTCEYTLDNGRFVVCAVRIS